MPVKPFSSAKTRLAGVLGAAERASLSRGFLDHALAVLAQVPRVAHTLVISRDQAALATAAQGGQRVRALAEPDAQGLNAALTLAAQTARAAGAGAVLVLPTDLPLLSVDEVEQLVSRDTGRPQMVIAPDRHEQGTNALLLRPPEAVPFAFGPESFMRHVNLAHHAGLPVQVCRLSGVALDVDVPEDLRLLQASRGPQGGCDGH